MWNSLTGIVNGKEDSILFIQTGPLEWAVRMPSSSLFKLPGRGQEVKIFLHLHHKEDDMTIFGFVAPEERDIFLQLLKVPGIGPKQALRILSGIAPAALVKILDDGDVEALKRIPGLGKATAGKIILALRGKLTLSEDSPGDVGAHGELVESLVNMGFEKKAVKKAVADAAAEQPGATEENLFRQALAVLSR